MREMSTKYYKVFHFVVISALSLPIFLFHDDVRDFVKWWCFRCVGPVLLESYNTWYINVICCNHPTQSTNLEHYHSLTRQTFRLTFDADFSR